MAKYLSPRRYSMDDKIDFIAYCIEEYKENEKLTGREVLELFMRHDIIVYQISL
jgi:hypothetical protein